MNRIRHHSPHVLAELVRGTAAAPEAPTRRGNRFARSAGTDSGRGGGKSPFTSPRPVPIQTCRISTRPKPTCRDAVPGEGTVLHPSGRGAARRPRPPGTCGNGTRCRTRRRTSRYSLTTSSCSTNRASGTRPVLEPRTSRPRHQGRSEGRGRERLFEACSRTGAAGADRSAPVPVPAAHGARGRMLACSGAGCGWPRCGHRRPSRKPDGSHCAVALRRWKGACRPLTGLMLTSSLPGLPSGSR